MQITAKGSFTVKRTALAWSDSAEGVKDASFARFFLDKQFQGDLEGTSQGQMLSTGSASGSGAYVALEKVTGVLQGQRGSFILCHRGIMHRGDPDLSISIVPESGTDDLSGICGEMKLDFSSEQHNFELLYTLTTMA